MHARRILPALLATLAAPLPLLAHGDHPVAYTGVLHTVAHLLPTAFVVALLVTMWRVIPRGTRGRAARSRNDTRSVQ